MTRLSVLVLCGTAALAVPAPIAARQQAGVTAAQVNGTWRSGRNEIRVKALGKNRLQIDFDLVYEYRSKEFGPTANTGEASGIATIEGDTATYNTNEYDHQCVITLRFTKGRMTVAQTGICGFGLHVTADGTYRKVSGRRSR